ncbi:hypothetical protein KAU11_07755 [Candidatus Babeliales bacterium]|nr:hypothetical protein [Candidatus Babeliales bacterium]
MSEKYWISELKDLHDQIERDVIKNNRPYSVSRVLRINARIEFIIHGFNGVDNDE